MSARKGKLEAKRRKSTGKDYFEARIPGLNTNERFYSIKIKSAEEGKLCYDILQRYNELGVVGGKRKAAVKLKYPEYSRTLPLKPLRSDFDITKSLHKEEAMEIILEQAQAAAKNLPENLRCSTPVVGSPSPSHRSSSHQNVHGKPLVAKQDLYGLCTIQLILQEISELVHHCFMSYTSKVMERERLESLVADINEESGNICLPKSGPDDFTYRMARFKQLMTIDEKIPPKLEMVEQGYKSHDSKCLELRKFIEVHNVKVIGRSIGKGNKTSGNERANEDERFPRVVEDCPSEEQKERGVSVLDSEGYVLPGSPLVDVWPFGTDATKPPAELGVSQHEFDKVADEDMVTWETISVDLPVPIGFRREEEDGSLPEVEWQDSGDPISLWISDVWIKSMIQS